jgi:hypothetical protein
MRSNILICLIASASLSGCAYQGVIAEKRFRPIPFADSLGVDAMYNFQLRDTAGQVHSQMVTPDVFANYRVGDYFNDLQPPPAPGAKELERVPAASQEMDYGPYQPVRVMWIQPVPKRTASRIAAHSHRHPRQTVRTATVRHRAKQTPKIAHHKKKRAKVASKPRVSPRKTSRA